MTLYELLKNRQNRQRLKEILTIFSEEGFGYLISKVNLSHHLPLTKRIKNRIAVEKSIPPQVRLRQAFEKLGPTFVKFGQLLSSRPDLIPAEFCAEFEKMQDKVPPFSFEEAKTIIETEFNQTLERLFSYFDPKPWASASISQVHKAKIKGKTVAVKVQRPGIKKVMVTDIELMYKIIELLELHVPEFNSYHLKPIVYEFERWTIKELNFRIEAYYAQKIAHNFAGSKIMKIPEIYSGYTTERVLTMEFLEGIPLHDIAALQRNKIAVRTVLKRGFYIFLKQIFIDGLFHADPHPGNILVLKGGKIGLIDFGIVGHFDKKLKDSSLEIFRAIINNNDEKLTEILLKMSSGGEVNREVLNREIKDTFEKFQLDDVKGIHISLILQETLHIINKYHLQIPYDFVLFAKTIITLEGVAIKYDPHFNLLKESKSTLDLLLDHTYFAKKVISKTKEKLNEYAQLAESFPETAAEILEKARRFKLNIDIEDKDVRDLSLELEHSSGNLSLGIIIAALIVASALVMQISNKTVFYIPGLILAGILSLWLIHRTIFAKLKKEV